MNGVAGVTDGVIEGVIVADGVNARMVAVAALGVYVWVAVDVIVGSVPVMVTVVEGVEVGGTVTVGATCVNVGWPGLSVLVAVGELVAVKVSVGVAEGVNAKMVAVAALGV